MARLRQSLTGSALDAIRGLGVTQPEYEEAKQILEPKFGGERRKLQAYMDQIERMPPLKSSDVQSFKKFADFSRIAMMKLQAEGRTGELQDGPLYSLLVKKFADRLVESYSGWLREHNQERLVLSLRDWLKEEVRIRVEAVEMAHGIAAESAEVARASVKRVERSGGSRTLFSTSMTSEERHWDRQPSHLACTVGETMGSGAPDDSRAWEWTSVGTSSKDKRFCFRSLASNHEGRDYVRARFCDINGCRRNHH